MTFFYPDYTVGFGIAPNPAAFFVTDTFSKKEAPVLRLVGFTTDRELHPAPKVTI